MLRRLVTLTLLALVCQAFSVTQAGALPPSNGGSAPAGRVGIQLLDAPVSRKGDPRAQVYIVDHLHPGAVIARHVQVVNKTSQTEHFGLYPAAASIRSGKFLAGAGRAGNELTGWISLDRAALDVPAGGTGRALVSIRVPKNASQGERYGVIWAQVAAKPSAGHSVAVTSRVGVRIYLDVGPGGEPRSDFTVERLTAVRTPDGTPQLVATVHNTGKRALDMTGSLHLRDGPGGTNAGPFQVRPGETPAPGTSVKVTVPLRPDLPAGPWTGTLTLRSGLVKHSVTTRFTFPAPGKALSLAATSRTQNRWWWIVLAVSVLVLAGCGAMLWLRRGKAAG